MVNKQHKTEQNKPKIIFFNKMSPEVTEMNLPKNPDYHACHFGLYRHFTLQRKSFSTKLSPQLCLLTPPLGKAAKFLASLLEKPPLRVPGAKTSLFCLPVSY